MVRGARCGLLSCGVLADAARATRAGPPGMPGFEPERFGGERGRGGPPLPGQRPPVHPDIAQLGGGDDDHLYL